MRKTFGKSVLVSMFLLFVLLLTSSNIACWKKKNLSSPKNIHMSMANDSANANPYSPLFSAIGRLMRGTLGRYDDKGNFHPYIAKNLVREKKAPNNWIIGLDSKRTFSNNTIIRLQDIKASIEAAAGIAKNPLFGLFKQADFKRVEVVSKTKLRVVFGKVWTSAKPLLGAVAVWPVSVIEAARAKKRMRLDTLVTSGAYKVTDYKPKAHALLVPTKKEGEPIRIRISKPKYARGLFKEKKVDLVYAEPVAQLYYRKIPHAKVLTYPYQDAISIASKCSHQNKGWVCNPTFRKALFLSLNEEMLRKLVARSGSESANGRIHVGQLNSFNEDKSKIETLQFNLNKAKTLLDKLGLKVGKNGLRIDPNTKKAAMIQIITYKSISEYPILLNRIASDISRQLKINVQPLSMTYTEFKKRLITPNSAPCFWIGEYPTHLFKTDPTLSASLSSESIPSKGGSNYTWLRNQSVDSYVKKVDQSEGLQRKQAAKSLHIALMSQYVVKPLYFVRDSWVLSSRITLQDFNLQTPDIKQLIFSWPEKLRKKKKK